MFWSKQSWLASENYKKGISGSTKGKQGRSRAAEGINVNMRYVVDKTGKPIDGYLAVLMRKFTRSFWAGLSDNGEVPNTWMSCSLKISDLFRSEMQEQFEELQYCEKGWKVDQIAIDYYSSWRKGRKKAGTFNVKIKKEQEGGDSDDSGDNDHEGNSSNDDGNNSDRSDEESITLTKKWKLKGKEPIRSKKSKIADKIADTPTVQWKRPTPRIKVCFFAQVRCRLICHP
jgi:hypothetical protein